MVSFIFPEKRARIGAGHTSAYSTFAPEISTTRFHFANSAS
jgi:hypothetical protein